MLGADRVSVAARLLDKFEAIRDNNMITVQAPKDLNLLRGEP